MTKQSLLGSHQRSWIWGRNVVVETLRAGRWTPHELRLAEDAGGLDEIAKLAESRSIRVTSESTARLAQLCGANDHQGVIAKMPPFPYAEVSQLVEDAFNDSNAPVFLITDHLHDAYNFGAIVRNAECFGAAGLFIPIDRQVGVTSQVARSSAGAVNAIPIARVANLLSFVSELQRRGVHLVAASEHAATPLSTADLSGPIAIVIGNEGRGIDQSLLEKCDLAISIPLAGRVGSLNAAVAAGVVLYEATRQRGIVSGTFKEA
ncbi:MAG: 23S rRNA (guanosine(2251)-2'-O)-methyltransferase RlmB [Planctomycetota bacterium]|nr:23S rRNA (guanosine(2251)-2'-O)-methyltransferase RlmB [Planctomycetaceae bacterium]MDQ3330587.1 23S rRNA (guanosine(2251)-2'-O)-methyltransferase RlmB [Planctomycetota bacterium]